MAAARAQLNPKLVVLLSLCFVLVTLLVALFLVRYPKFAGQQVVEQLIFKNGTLQTQQSHSTDQPKSLRVAFYLFNVTNAHDFVGGNRNAKLLLDEIGPFVNQELKMKEFTQSNQTDGLITYKLRKGFAFDASASVSDPKLISITWPNVPMLAVQGAFEQMSVGPERDAARLAIEAAVLAFNESAFIVDTAERLLFVGSESKMFAALQGLNLPLVKPFVGAWLGSLLKDNKFGLLYGKNDSWHWQRDYLYTVSTGFELNRTSYENLSQFVHINGSSRLAGCTRRAGRVQPAPRHRWRLLCAPNGLTCALGSFLGRPLSAAHVELRRTGLVQGPVSGQVRFGRHKLAVI